MADPATFLGISKATWALISKIAGWTALALSAASSYRQFRAQRSAQREGAVIDAKSVPDASGLAVPYVFGLTVVPGYRAYNQIGSHVESRANLGPLAVDESWIGNLDLGGGIDDLEYLMLQDVLSIGALRSVVSMLFNQGNSVFSSTDRGGLRGYMYGTWQPGGVPSSLASQLSVSRHWPSERDNSAKFTGLSFATIVNWNNIEGSDRPWIFGPPDYEYIVQGIEAAPTGSLPRVAETLLELLEGSKPDFSSEYEVAEATFTGPESDAKDYSIPPIWGGGRYGALSRYTNGGRRSDDFIPADELMRYEFNGTISSDADWDEARRKLLAPAPGALLYRDFDGSWKLDLPRWAEEPESTEFSLSDIVDGQFTISEAEDPAQQGTVHFGNSKNGFAPDTLVFPSSGSVAHKALVDQDGRDESIVIEAPGVNTQEHGSTVCATVIQLSHRRGLQLPLDFDWYLRLKPGENILFTGRRWRIEQVDAMRISGTLCCVLHCQEWDKDDFAPVTEDDVPFEAIADRDLGVAAPTLAASFNSTDRAFEITWVRPNRAFQIAVQVRLNLGAWRTIGIVDAFAGSMPWAPPFAQLTVEFRAKSYRRDLTQSTWGEPTDVINLAQPVVQASGRLRLYKVTPGLLERNPPAKPEAVIVTGWDTALGLEGYVTREPDWTRFRETCWYIDAGGFSLNEVIEQAAWTDPAPLRPGASRNTLYARSAVKPKIPAPHNAAD